MVDWKDNTDGDFQFDIDPQDGKEPFRYWWEDMRPREVRDSIKEAYERGMDRAQGAEITVKQCRKCPFLNHEFSVCRHPDQGALGPNATFEESFLDGQVDIEEAVPEWCPLRKTSTTISLDLT